jgi:hypothetical protein
MLNNITPRELKPIEEIIAAQRMANLPLQKQSLL